MEFARTEGPSHLVIQRIEAGAVTIGGHTYTESLLVTPTGVVEWTPADIEELAAEHVAALAEHTPEIVLLGTGPRLRFPAPALQLPLIQRGIGVEIMDNAAACRTYNLLLSENRRVLAALLIDPNDAA